jgi:hypothetical protein
VNPTAARRAERTAEVSCEFDRNATLDDRVAQGGE